MNKAVRKILSALSVPTLILSGSLPLMGAEIQRVKPPAEVQKVKPPRDIQDVKPPPDVRQVAPRPVTGKPAVDDKRGSGPCGWMKEKPAVDDKKGTTMCGVMKPDPTQKK